MNKKLYLVLLAALTIAGCEKDDDENIKLTGGNKTLEVYSVVNNSIETTLEAKSSWTAKSDAGWLDVSPAKGEAGDNLKLTLTTTQTNRTKATRTAKVTIKSGGDTKTLTIKQRADYAVFDKKQYELTAAGGTLDISFKTNMNESDIQIYSTEGLEVWVVPEEKQTRAEKTMKFVPLKVTTNTSRDSRDGALFLTMIDDKGNPLALDTLWVHQEGLNDGYVSTDYSEDGKVTVLQKATKGKGIPFVLMGDGFTDLDIQDSTYVTVMRRTMENLFSEEPIRSLRDYFDVYMVNAVSANNYFTEQSQTAFSCLPDNQSTEIRSDDGRIGDYMRKVEGIDSLNALAVVVLNSNIYKGVTYLYSNKPKPGLKQHAIALFPVIENLESETFRAVAVHESIGHGLAKLADEYAHDEQGAATDDILSQLRYMHGYGWMKNVDSEGDETKVLWKSFIGDNHFQNEKIGVYEGGYTYFKGIYRPSDDSMMNRSKSPFNAPSRQLIYNKVIELGEGRTPSYDEFVAFDEQHKPQSWDYSTRSLVSYSPWQLPVKGCVIIK
jgi:hypothetical protein